MNSFKYAFNETKSLQIIISLFKREKYIQFDYKDNGPGKKPSNKLGFGTTMIENLIQDLPEGCCSNYGLEWKIRFVSKITIQPSESDSSEP
ncbi:MAG: hypothetical protein PQJ61_08360 [Spirochaetales bacterium]|uniref:Histidine kinase/HSP90-like ATPase domain-containing protein n=1 Tax=Candidatus Thalassospirochaeta sargassi TaxID=3119039 RepID=A0AAJ1IEN7_9SPIO|nr:hypothetical protein [Spirochaetales bacterium]